MYNITQHKQITSYKDLINILRVNFGSNYSEQFLNKQLNGISQNKYEKVQDYASRIELALYQLTAEMTKDKSNEESKIIINVVPKQAQNIFIDGLHQNYRTVLRAMKLNTLEEMIKAALEEEQANDNIKPKFNNTVNYKMNKPKCFNYDTYGHLSRECRKPRKNSNIEIKKEPYIKMNIHQEKRLFRATIVRRWVT